jgi:hypothetical protein
MLQKAILATILTLGLTAAAYQGDCQGKAKECKSPVGNAHYYPDQRCTCFTCESGTTREKIICTRDENEAKALETRMRNDTERNDREKNASKDNDRDKSKVKDKPRAVQPPL